MKFIRPFTQLMFLAACLSLSACFKEECDEKSSRSYPVAHFATIEAGEQHELTILQSDSFSVTATGCTNDLNDLVVEVSGTKLVIRYPHYRKHRERVSFLITMPTFTGTWLSGQSKATITGFNDTATRIFDLSGQSSCIFTGNARQTQCYISGQSHITQYGIAKELLVNLSGQSEYEGYGVLQNTFTQVSASGQSSAWVNTSGTLFATASGQSNIFYRGNPVVKQFSSSGQSIIAPR